MSTTDLERLRPLSPKASKAIVDALFGDLSDPGTAGRKYSARCLEVGVREGTRLIMTVTVIVDEETP